MNGSNQMIGSHYAWETLGYKVEGMVVAIIDSGIDYRHQAMSLDQGVEVGLNQPKIERLIRDKKLKGRYFSEKIPYGHNYYDHNDNILDSYGHMHGMHVAGKFVLIQLGGQIADQSTTDKETLEKEDLKPTGERPETEQPSTDPTNRNWTNQQLTNRN